MRALRRLDWHGRQAIRAVTRGRRWSRCWFRSQAIHLTHQQKHCERHDQKINYCVQEQAVIERRGARGFCRRHRVVVRSGQTQKEI